MKTTVPSTKFGVWLALCLLTALISTQPSRAALPVETNTETNRLVLSDNTVSASPTASASAVTSPASAGYYSNTPPGAEHVAQSAWLNAAVRIMLVPIVGAVQYPLLSMLGTMIVGLAGLLLIRRLRRQLH